MTDLQVVSLFAGIGGIDRGLDLAGASTALMCELDPHARKILARHYPHAAIHNDVTELTADDCRTAGAVPERTILTAGFPCQDLSVAGRRRGMGEGTRSGLYWHVDRLLAEFRPAWVILENVPGLLSAACPCPGDGTCADTCPGELHAVSGGVCEGGCVNVHGGTMGAVLGSLANRGYGFAYRVLDARHFGVPQRRRRVVIVGRLGDTGAAAAQVLLEPEGVPGNPAAGITPRPVVAGAAREGVARGGRGYAPDVAHSLMAHGGRDKLDPTMFTYVAEHVTALDTAQGGADDNTAQGGQLVAFAEPEVIVRRLTPLELERLQGFPDGWTEGQADTQRSKQLGNSVAVPVFEWVGRRLVAVDAQLGDS
jgi:DNA (cytosine-5)-methyltransferase 1